MKIVPYAVVLSVATLLAGCQIFNAERHDEEQAEVFGASVQNMIQSQIATPQAAGTVPAPAAMDADKAVDAVKTYRNDKAYIEGSKASTTLLLPSQILDR